MIDPKYVQNKDFSLDAITFWLANGFFLDDQNFNSIKNNNYDYGPNIKWFNAPKNISFQQSVIEFGEILDRVIAQNTKNNKIILPLSGGLDSRTLAASLLGKKNVVVVSYEFQGGVKETNYARRIAKECGWEFYPFKIKSGYLWNVIDEISEINHCQIDFTHSRQMAVINEISKYGDLFLLGHWGDVLFDVPKIGENSNLSTQARYTMKMISKPGGIELAEELWDYWGLKNNFKKALFENIYELLSKINIENPRSNIRAFKSMHWAKRWANPGLGVFSSRGAMCLPYYNEEICNFICTIPEKYLSNRMIQIEYIKQKAPALAKIPWQVYDLDLFSYKNFNSVYLPRRVSRYIKRMVNEKILNAEPLIERNWELQFLGSKNESKLMEWLFETPELNKLVPKIIIENYYNKFKYLDPIKYSHPIGMLLVLAVWCKKNI